MNEMRNPFPYIGKVMKYEFKHSYRVLLPLYGVLLVLGFLTGISSDPEACEKIIRMAGSNFSMQYESQIQGLSIGMARGLCGIAFGVLVIASAVITVVILERRFKTSMLGDEAYLNLSLPVTIGEQLWGRFLADLIWIAGCVVVVMISFLLCFMRYFSAEGFKEVFSEIINTVTNEDGIPLGVLIIDSIVIFITGSALVITFVFFINSITHFFRKNKGFVAFVSAIILMIIYGKIGSLFPTMRINDFENWGIYFQRAFLIGTGVNIGFTALNFLGTHYIFSKQLNLE